MIIIATASEAAENPDAWPIVVVACAVLGAIAWLLRDTGTGA